MEIPTIDPQQQIEIIKVHPMGIQIRVMKVLKNLEYHHWHSLKSKLDYQ